MSTSGSIPTAKLTGEKPVFATLTAKLKAVAAQPRLWSTVLLDEAPRHFRSPVRWLLGRDLLTYLRSISLYSSNGQELDHRDWMHPDVVAWDQPEMLEEGAFWFDYFSDSGDGQMAMYSLAYLTLGDLWQNGQGNDVSMQPTANATRLPRGRFLFVGGDTAYHVADRATIAERFSAPFDWAHADRLADGTLGADDKPRYLLGIPGNHDYYDALLGFNHLFRYNTTPKDGRPLVADFQRRQNASFVTLQLPFGWWFWGLDTQHGRIDWRQRQFYRDLGEANAPKRLIVATPEPTTVFGHVFEGFTQPFEGLRLPRPFTNGQVPKDDEIHLDIAGDVHHYARYERKGSPNYASVVSGGGGAFLHPTHTSVPPKPETDANQPLWPEKPTKIFPDYEVSCRDTTLRLLCPWKIFQGGYVWLIGAVCAAIVYFGAAVAPHTQAVGRWLSDGLMTLSPWEVPALAPRVPSERSVAFFEKVAPAVVPTEDTVLLPASPLGQPNTPTRWPAEIPAALLLVMAVVGSFALSGKALAEARVKVVRLRRYWPTGLCALATVPAVVATYQALGGVHTKPVRHGFWCSAMVLMFAVPLILAWVWTSRYVATLPKQAKYRPVTWIDYGPPWVAMGLGVLSLFYGLVTYGVHPIGQTASDIVFVFALLFVGLGPAGLGYFQAASHRPWWARLAFAGLGFYLGALQIVVPLILALGGSWVRTVAALTLALMLTGLAALWFATLGRARHLWLLWLISGALVMAVAAVGHADHAVSLTRMFVAFASGGALTCIWFGWYLAASLAFGGHNNEAGGAARLDRHRHFIRFKLEPNKLTGFVIALNKPEAQGRKLHPTLVDVFELQPKMPAN